MFENFNQTTVDLTILMDSIKTRFTKSEQKLYTYIKKNLDLIVYQSLTELANAAMSEKQPCCASVGS